MKYGFKIMFCMFFLFIGLVSYAYAQDVVDLGVTSNPQPTIIVDFSESEDFGGIVSYSLVNSSGDSIDIEEIYHEGKVYKYRPTSILKNNEEYKFSITYEDDVGNEDSKTYLFRVEISVLNISLIEPSYGYSKNEVINITIKTDRDVICKYTFNLGGLDFSSPILDEFSKDGLYHRIFNKRIEDGYLLYVICNDSFTETYPSKYFTLKIERNPPIILSAYAEPSEITDLPLSTFLNVKTDQETRCYYNLTTEGIVIAGEFPEEFSTEHRKFLDMSGLERKGAITYNFRVICENRAGLTSETIVPVTIDLYKEFGISSIEYPEYVSSSRVRVNVTTTRDALSCRLSFNESMENAVYMEWISEKSYSGEINNLEEGENKIYIECSGGVPVTTSKRDIKVVRDSIPPKINSIEVNQVREDRIYLTVNVSDDGSGVKELEFSLYLSNNSFIENITKDYDEDCEYTLTLDEDLNESETYYLIVRAIDNVGLYSSEEVIEDIKIGEEEELLKDGEQCSNDYECESGFCNPNGICSEPSCSDSFLSPGETDVDCGGVCVEEGKRCEIGKRCEEDSDCESDYCDPSTKRCEEENTCENNRFDKEYESDVDCGKTCPPCGIGKRCEEDSDCISGNCEKGVCEDKDSDGDGIPDSEDNCVDESNPDQEDFDEDGKGDVCDPDDDGDSLLDNWEIKYGLNPKDRSDVNRDKDGDGLSNLEEQHYGTDPIRKDSDGDGFSDKEEIDRGTDPLNPNDRPSSPIMTIVFVIIFLGLLGFGIYFGYKGFKGKTRKEEKKIPLLPEKPIQRVYSRPFKKRVVKPKKKEDRFKIFEAFEEGISKKDIKKEEKVGEESKKEIKKEGKGYIEIKPKKELKEEDKIFEELSEFIEKRKKQRK